MPNDASTQIRLPMLFEILVGQSCVHPTPTSLIQGRRNSPMRCRERRDSICCLHYHHNIFGLMRSSGTDSGVPFLNSLWNASHAATSFTSLRPIPKATLFARTSRDSSPGGGTLTRNQISIRFPPPGRGRSIGPRNVMKILLEQLHRRPVPNPPLVVPVQVAMWDRIGKTIPQEFARNLTALAVPHGCGISGSLVACCQPSSASYQGRPAENRTGSNTRCRSRIAPTARASHRRCFSASRYFSAALSGACSPDGMVEG